MLQRLAVVAALALLCLAPTVFAQPLTDPYPFAFGPTVQIDTALLGPVEPAGAKGRVKLSDDGHLVSADGERLRLYGVTIQFGGCFPDSATAIATARRLRALGVNLVRFTGFDYVLVPPISFFDGGTTTGGVNAERMRRFDWFMHQLKQQGIYSVLTFYAAWQPLPDDGVRQYDSVGWGCRVPIFFDRTAQQIHRNMMRSVLEHVNPFTGNAYKDEPAMPYAIAFEDASLAVYWLYSKDVSRENIYGSVNLGSQQVALIDSLFIASMKNKGATTDAALQTRWSTQPASTENRLKNGGFEDPFSAAWTLGVNTTGGAQAVEQISDSDVKEGTSCYRLRVGKLGASRQPFDIILSQSISPLKRSSRHRLTFWARTTPQRGQRSMMVYAFNSTYPYDNYGLNKDLTLTSTWQRFDITFTSISTDEATAALAFFCGADSGDVYLDDVRFVEIGHEGLAAGESVAAGKIRRNLFWEEDVSPARMKDVAGFYREQLTSLFDGVYKLVRDTLKSDMLLCPSLRFVSHWENVAADSFDITSSTEWRTTQVPILNETSDAGLYSHVQLAQAGKAHIVHHASIQFPRSFQNDMMAFLPGYAGLHDWDGVVQGVFSGAPVYAATRIDSAQIWELYNKPNVLALMPATALRLRRGDVAASTKKLTIAVANEALEYPRRFTQPFFLNVYSDQRMSLFRTVEMQRGTQAVGSFLPHREISVLTGDVDRRQLDAENEQIFWNSDLGVYRLVTPRSISVTGALQGEIHDVGPMRVEQTAGAGHATVALTSLDSLPLDVASQALMVISTRALNEGAEFDVATNELSKYGRGATQMEGATMRLTMPSGGADSLLVQALGADGRPSGWSRTVAPSALGRFTFTINTAQAATPWFMLRYVRVPTSVGEHDAVAIRIVHDGASGTVRTYAPNGSDVQIVALDGSVALRTMLHDAFAETDLSSLASGAYVVRVAAGGTVRSLPIMHLER
ncbi:MAG: hypothetical protein FGM24_01560 [Candidatus Kapabacteria bacterium]|nr:hypothetical protein [Candidatus Kapabacteria bacterium]